jgi:hypothetical protein
MLTIDGDEASCSDYDKLDSFHYCLWSICLLVQPAALLVCHGHKCDQKLNSSLFAPGLI